MKRAAQLSGKYSVTEIALSGLRLKTEEKTAARKLLLNCRVPERGLVVSDYKGLFRLSCYTRSEKKVQEIRTRYRTLSDCSFSLKIKKLRRRDWFDKWKRDYHIKPLGSKFMIVPVWEEHKLRPGPRLPIFLEPGSAFGSGYHETTRLMTRLLESLEDRIGSFLDIGCGTGILSVAAAKLGAGKIIGFDNDKPSALVAVKNFQKNWCEGGRFLCAQLKRSKICGHFDAVGANLLSKTLLEYREKIVARVRPGGYLLVSGIVRQNFPSFKRGFAGLDLRCLKILRGHRWVAVLYQRRPSV